MAKILIISEDLWYPPHGGDALRQYHLLRNLHDRHEFTWCCRFRTVRDKAEKDEGITFARSESMFIPRPPIAVKVIKALSCLASNRPIKQAAHVFAKIRRKVWQLTSKESFDIIQIEHTKNAEYAKAIAPSCQALKILTIQNLAHLYYERASLLEKSILHRLYAKLESRRYLTYEKSVLKWFDGFVAVSEENISWLKAMGVNKNMHLSRNGIDVGNIPFFSQVEKPVILFVGNMDYEPNIGAVVWFSKEVLPLVWEKRPDTLFHIVGRNPTREVEALESESRIRIFINVPDLNKYYREAAFTVVPIRIGAGTRLKIVESMAFGRVVLSTKVGAEGLIYRDGVHLLIADDPGYMASMALKLLQDIGFRNRIAIDARKQVETNYNCNIIAEELNGFYEEMLSSRNKGKSTKNKT